MASLFVQNAGRQQCGAGCGWGPGVRDHFVLQHILSGRGSCVVDGQRHALEAGDSFLIFPDTTVQYEADREEPWEYAWVGFNGAEAGRYVEQTGFSRQSPVCRGDGGGQLPRLLEEIRGARGTAMWNDLRMTGRLYALLAYLVESAWDSRPARRDGDSCAEAAADYIMRHYAEAISVEQLAEHFALSHSSLYRKFVRRFQKSPKRFLLEYRMERACQLLAAADLSVQEVAVSVGFDDPFYFSRVFKELVGVSPRRYAREQGKAAGGSTGDE